MLRRLSSIIIMNIATLGILLILCGHKSECQMLMTPFPKVHNQIFELLQGSKDKEPNGTTICYVYLAIICKIKLFLI